MKSIDFFWVLVLLICLDSPAQQSIEKFDVNFVQETGNKQEIIWYDAMTAPGRLSGFCFVEQDKVYRRMPLNPPEALPPGVENLSWHTSGGQFRFRTDSTFIKIRVKLRPFKPMLMGRSSQSSFDLFRGIPGGERFCGIAIPQYGEDEYERELWRVSDRRMEEYALNFPLYQGVEKLEIGLDPQAIFAPPTQWRVNGAVIVYGGSTLQGAQASRPGNTWTMMVSRKLNVEFANMGFSGSGKTESSVARALAMIKNPAMFVMCSDSNSTPEMLHERFHEFIRILRASYPETPILVLTRGRWGLDLRGNLNRAAVDRDAERRDKAAFLEQAVAEFRNNGDRNIYFMDGSINTEDDFDVTSVDGSHMNDLGFYRTAQKVEPVISKILNLK